MKVPWWLSAWGCLCLAAVVAFFLAFLVVAIRGR